MVNVVRFLRCFFLSGERPFRVESWWAEDKLELLVRLHTSSSLSSAFIDLQLRSEGLFGVPGVSLEWQLLSSEIERNASFNLENF